MFKRTGLVKPLIYYICLFIVGCSGPDAVRTVFLADGSEENKLELYRNIPDPEERGISRIEKISDGAAIRNYSLPPPEDMRDVLSMSPDGNYIAYRRLGGFSITAVSPRGAIINTFFKLYDKPYPDMALTLSWSPDSQFIAYSLDDVLYTARRDGSEQRRVSTSSLYRLATRFAEPVYFWLGSTRLIYLGKTTDSNKNINASLYTVDFDGKNEIKLSAGEDVYPSINPIRVKELWIIYSSIDRYREPNQYDLYTVGINGHGRRLIDTDILFGSVQSVEKWILYKKVDRSSKPLRFDLYAVLIDGTGKRLIDRQVSKEPVQLSDDRILYRTAERSAKPGQFDLYTVNFDGSGKRQVDRNVSIYKLASDKSRVAYTTDRLGNGSYGLYTALPDGTQQQNINRRLAIGGTVAQFDWAPNSQRIAFIADVVTKGINMLCSVSPRGGPVINHTLGIPGYADVTSLKWTADSNSLLYTLDNHTGDSQYNKGVDFYLTSGIKLESNSLINHKKGYHISWLQWSPNGRYLAYILTSDKFDYKPRFDERKRVANPENRLYVYDRDTNTSKQLSPLGRSVFLSSTTPNSLDIGISIAWFSDSSQIVYRSYSHKDYVPPGLKNILLSSKVDGSRTDLLSGIMANLNATVRDFRIIH